MDAVFSISLLYFVADILYFLNETSLIPVFLLLFNCCIGTVVFESLVVNIVRQVFVNDLIFIVRVTHLYNLLCKYRFVKNVLGWLNDYLTSYYLYLNRFSEVTDFWSYFLGFPSWKVLLLLFVAMNFCLRFVSIANCSHIIRYDLNVMMMFLILF